MNTEKITTLKLLSSHDEVGNIRTFIFENNGLSWIAGQNQGYRLKKIGENPEENERWFTISSAPSEKTINISTRISESVFKQTLNALTVGEEIECYELGGDFIWTDENHIIMVAGGIGITPFRSILVERDLSGQKLNTTLLYFNRNEEIPFKNELESLNREHSEFKVIFIVGERVSAQKIKELIPNITDEMVYISGPEAMVDKVGDDLEQDNIQIKKDRFPGYDIHNF